MSDLLDVLHYMFEVDVTPTEDDVRSARDHQRTSMYTGLYGYKEYTWKKPDTRSAGGTGDSAYTRPYVDAPMDAPVDTPPTTMTHKSYVPPTTMDLDAALPFGRALDAPLG